MIEHNDFYHILEEQKSSNIETVGASRPRGWLRSARKRVDHALLVHVLIPVA
jgi:hypothetical protein